MKKTAYLQYFKEKKEEIRLSPMKKPLYKQKIQKSKVTRQERFQEVR